MSHWKGLEKSNPGLVILCLELKDGQNLMEDHLYGYLCNLAKRGKIDMIFGGPPCRTVSLGRFRGIWDGGPRPLRGRVEEGKWGLPHLGEDEQEKVDGDSIRTMYLTYAARRGNPECETTLEQPRDTAEHKEDNITIHYGYGYPSFLVWKETQMVMEVAQLRKSTFDQGAYGHEKKKPTTMISSSPEVHAMDGMESDQDLPRTLTVKERERVKMWQKRQDSGHLPYRRDCAVCVFPTQKDCDT